jgi:Uncharacterized conserved protein
MEKIIIVGHGSLKKSANNLEFISNQVANALKKSKSDVKFAYLQFGKPDLDEVINQCITEGATKIIIHPFFISEGSHVTHGIPSIIENFKKKYPALKIIYTKPLGLHNKLISLVAELIEEANNKNAI